MRHVRICIGSAANPRSGNVAGGYYQSGYPGIYAERYYQRCLYGVDNGVNPGFGGQKFIAHTVDKVRELRELITVTGSEALIEVDGGVNLDTGSRLVDAGADALVAGNAVFSAPDPTEAIRALKNL